MMTVWTDRRRNGCTADSLDEVRDALDGRGACRAGARGARVTQGRSRISIVRCGDGAGHGPGSRAQHAQLRRLDAGRQVTVGTGAPAGRRGARPGRQTGRRAARGPRVVAPVRCRRGRARRSAARRRPAPGRRAGGASRRRRARGSTSEAGRAVATTGGATGGHGPARRRGGAGTAGSASAAAGGLGRCSAARARRVAGSCGSRGDSERVERGSRRRASGWPTTVRGAATCHDGAGAAVDAAAPPRAGSVRAGLSARASSTSGTSGSGASGSGTSTTTLTGSGTSCRRCRLSGDDHGGVRVVDGRHQASSTRRRSGVVAVAAGLAVPGRLVLRRRLRRGARTRGREQSPAPTTSRARSSHRVPSTALHGHRSAPRRRSVRSDAMHRSSERSNDLRPTRRDRRVRTPARAGSRPGSSAPGPGSRGAWWPRRSRAARCGRSRRSPRTPRPRRPS